MEGQEGEACAVRECFVTVYDDGSQKSEYMASEVPSTLDRRSKTWVTMCYVFIVDDIHPQFSCGSMMA